MAELPQNWIETELVNITNLYTGNSINESVKKEKYTNLSEGFNYIATKDIGYDKSINYKNGIKIPFEETSFKIAPKGSVLLCIEGGSAGRKLAFTNEDVCFVNKLCAFVSRISTEHAKFIYYYFQSNDFKTIFHENKNGLIGGVSLNKLKQIKIIQPPLNEQKRIVEKLDKIMRIVDGVNARLDKIPTALKRARQSILNQAITGELTKDWREKNNIKDTWKETSLKSIVLTYKNGLSKRSGKEGKATVVLRLADFCNHKIIKDNIREIKITDNEAKQYRLDYNDILIIRVNGSEDIVGRFILYDLNENWIYCDHLIRLKYDKTKIEPYYLFYYAQTNVVREYIKANVVSSAGQNTINQKTLDNMPLLLPSIDEQAEIVRRVKLAFEKLDKIELRYQKTKEYSDKLTQSILNKAFRGELVPQDPSDKPISLDEIQAQIVEKSSKKRKTLKNNKVQEMVKEIIEILKEYPEGISPEELFKNSKYSQKDFTDDDIIEFYKELSNLLDSKLTEEKDSVNHKILIKKVK